MGTHYGYRPTGNSPTGLTKRSTEEDTPSFQGSTSGYASGGNISNSNSDLVTGTIDKFPFASDTNATDVGDLTQDRSSAAGQSSSSHGYSSGSFSSPGDPSRSNIIDKFPFAVDANATDVGDITVLRGLSGGQSSTDNGYVSGGFNAPPFSLFYNIIDKFPFSVDTNASDVGDLTQARQGLAGQSSLENGYSSGGWAGPTGGQFSNIIEKFPFASDANASDVGDLTQSRSDIHAGQSSEANGYTSGGLAGPPNVTQTTIDKFPFATDANATDVGDTTTARQDGAGQSSTSKGYTSGGGTGNSPAPILNIIESFPFAADANATDVGDLSQTRRDATGQQV